MAAAQEFYETFRKAKTGVYTVSKYLALNTIEKADHGFGQTWTHVSISHSIKAKMIFSSKL